jgi:pectin methylesterase-like acyl-CoA thioesterase
MATISVGNGGYATIQAAVDAATNGDVILVAAGIYDEDLRIDKGVQIRGAQHGTAGSDGGRDAVGGVGETTIIGRSEVTVAVGVTLDGLRFLNDATTTGGGSGAPTLQFTAQSSGGAHVVTNSVFWSTVAGGTNDDRAISSEVIPSFSRNMCVDSCVRLKVL